MSLREYNKKLKNPKENLLAPRYLSPRKRASKIKDKYITEYMRKNRKAINDRNNALFREAKRKQKE